MRSSNGEMGAQCIGKMAPKFFTFFPPLNIFFGPVLSGSVLSGPIRYVT